MNSEDAVPKFVYGIIASLFVFFNVFAVNMFLQYRKIGPWREYLFGERMYILLSLICEVRPGLAGVQRHSKRLTDGAQGRLPERPGVRRQPTVTY